MIKTFKHKGLELYFKRNESRLLDSRQLPKIKLLLDHLDASEQISDMSLPGFGLHQLKGEKQGYWSIKVTGNWRITFRYENMNAFEVNLEDYH
jgi:proteic killer suppression protein